MTLYDRGTCLADAFNLKVLSEAHDDEPRDIAWVGCRARGPRGVRHGDIVEPLPNAVIW